MLKKVLGMNEYNDGKVITKGLLSLESGEKLSGTLKLFDGISGDAVLILKIGDNTLVFDNIKDTKNFVFETVFHDINLPVCAVLSDGTKVLCVAKSINYSDDYHSLLKELYIKEETKSSQTIKAQNSDDEFFELKKDDLKEKIEETDNFFESIKPQIDLLFSENEHFEELEQKLEQTEWVKVLYNGEYGDHYILGKIKDGDKITHICYGIPASSKENLPPENMLKYCQWLPIDSNDENGFGYWVSYQDAKTGENIILE